MSAADWLRVRIGDYRFAFPTDAVQDVFTPREMTPVPRSPGEVAGILNLRGRIVTVIHACRALGLAEVAPGHGGQAVSFEIDGDLYGLLVEGVDDVVPIDPAAILAPPAVSGRWAGVVEGLVRVDGHLVIVSHPRLFVFPSPSHALASPASVPDPGVLLESFVA
jgi:purine-binding chemotaxis protein CheW